MDDRKLLAMAEDIKKNSYSPYSKFRVGAAVLAKSGKVFTGVNIENASFGATVCAERTAVFKAVSEGEREIAAVAISSDMMSILSVRYMQADQKHVQNIKKSHYRYGKKHDPKGQKEIHKACFIYSQHLFYIKLEQYQKKQRRQHYKKNFRKSPPRLNPNAVCSLVDTNTISITAREYKAPT